MAYDHELADRTRATLKGSKGLVEKRMFGGLCFLLNGNILVGVWKDSLIVRVGIDHYDSALREPFTREFNVTGHAMKGWVMVDLDGLDDAQALKDWIDKAKKFVSKLPKK